MISPMPTPCARDPFTAQMRPSPGFAVKRAFLESGAAWPDQPPPKIIETQASLVCLTHNRAWKLKKPVHTQHGDMRTLYTRTQLCVAELHLNRALAGPMYRALVPMVRRPCGGLALDGPGRVVDWLIEMDSLPATEFLDQRIQHGPQPRTDEIRALGAMMIAFYRRQSEPRGAGDLYHTRLMEQMQTDIVRLRAMRAQLGGVLRDDVLENAAEMSAKALPEIRTRAALGLVIEGHGNLHAGHVCLLHPPRAFNRVEFDYGYRLIDPYDELTALGIDCARLGADWIGLALRKQLSEAGIQPPTPALLRLYSLARCLSQARVALDNLRSPDISASAPWAPRARAFLAIATQVLGRNA